MGRIITTILKTATCAVIGLALAGLVAPCAQAGPGFSPAPGRVESVAKSLTLEALECSGSSQNGIATIRGYLGLEAGDPVDQGAILAGVERLRATGFYDSVDFYTRPGSRPGAIVLIVEVVETGPQLRLGTGNSDLDGWYLIPIEACFDNLTGRGERAALQLRFGYRLTGLFAHYERGFGPHEKTLWGARVHGYALDQVYFDDGIEYAQPVTRGGLDLHWGRKLGGGLSLTGGLRAESVEVDSTGIVWHDDDFAGVQRNDEVPFDELPNAVADAVGKYERVAWRADLTLDRRSRERRVGSPAAGVWGRLRVESVHQKTTEEREGLRDDRFGSASLDFRAYRSLGDGVLAWSARGAVVGSKAFFPDRFALGGLYTVRGFPSASLSAAGGDRSQWVTSLEYRAALAGPVVRPRISGSVFVDAGGTGEHGSTAAVGAGWGLRVRLFDEWTAGLDVAAPLTDTPVRESFHAHLALGWRF